MAETHFIWYRQRGEPILSYEMFLHFLEVGAGRSNEAVAQRFSKTTEEVATLRSTWRWARRARAYDDHIVRVQQAAIDKALADEAVIWAQRRSIFKEREFKLCETLMSRAEEMANAPLYETTINRIVNVGGQEVAVDIHMMPTKWNLRDATEFFRTASQTMRLSLELDTFRATVDLRLPDDVADRLKKARAVLDKLKDGLEKAVDEMLERDPTLDRSQLSVRLLEKYIGWTAKNMEIEVGLLTEGDGIVQQMADQINASSAAPVDDSEPGSNGDYDVH